MKTWMTNRKFDIRRLYAFMSSEGGEGGSANVAAVEDGSVSATVEHSSEGGKPAGVDWASAVPDEYKEKPYIQELLKTEKPGEELFKQFDNLQKMLGQPKTGVPKADAADEEWDKFFDTLAPKSADEYDLKPLEFGDDKKELAEFYNGYRTEDEIKAAKELAHKHKIPARIFNKFAADWEAAQLGKAEKIFNDQKQAQADLDGKFENLMKENFGGDVEAVRKQAKAFVGEFVPKDMQEAILGLPNEALIYLAYAAKGVNAKYEKEDSFRTTATSSGKADAVSLKTEMETLMAQDAYRNKFHVEHATTFKRVQELSKQIADLQRAK